MTISPSLFFLPSLSLSLSLSPFKYSIYIQMTVSYNLDLVHTSLFGFLKLQLRWRGSVWKAVIFEVLVFCLLFLSISMVYNQYLSPDTKKFWDDFSALFDSKMDYIPLTFMLGFFVTIIVDRWNEIFNNVGWIDPCALLISTYLRGNDEKSRMLRRNCVRYLVLTQVLVYRDISLRVRKRFPSLETILAAGFITTEELKSYNECNLRSLYPKYFLPIQWAFNILYEARVAGKISADLQLNEMIKYVMEFRNGLAKLTNFDWVPIPLEYPQVVFLAVRLYFLLALIARQSILIDGAPPNPDHPAFMSVSFIMTSLQYLFYVGWMKVAQSLMNPLGEDDNDFECNFLIDRNLQLGLTIVDDTYQNVPTQTKDIFWSEKNVDPLYTSDTANMPMCPQIGSASQYESNKDEVVMMPYERNEPEMELDGDEERLLPRVVSVVSVNKECGGSRMSLNSRKGTRGFIGSLRKQFSRSNMNLPSTRVYFGEGRISRPSRLGMMDSISSLNTLESSPFDIIDHNEKNTEERLSTDTQCNTPISPRRSPAPPNEGLVSVPEEDEENQRTRTSNDLRNWLAEVNKGDKKDII